VSRDFNFGTNVSCEESTVSDLSLTGLIYILLLRFMTMNVYANFNTVAFVRDLLTPKRTVHPYRVDVFLCDIDQYLMYVLRPGLTNDHGRLSAPGTVDGGNRTSYVVTQNRILGFARMRQVRVYLYIFVHRIGRNKQTENRKETQRKYLTKK